jgi:hypothetical protein
MGKLAKQIEQQIDADLDQAFRAFVKFVWLELSTEVISPAYTGFFASSWKVSNTRPRPKDEVENFAPWSQIKKDKARLGSAHRAISPQVEPRFSFPSFTSSDTVYIGNTAKYARYALQRPSGIVPFLYKAEAGAKLFFGAKPGVSLRVSGTGTDRGARYQGVV